MQYAVLVSSTVLQVCVEFECRIIIIHHLELPSAQCPLPISAHFCHYGCCCTKKDTCICSSCRANNNNKISICHTESTQSHVHVIRHARTWYLVVTLIQSYLWDIFPFVRRILDVQSISSTSKIFDDRAIPQSISVRLSWILHSRHTRFARVTTWHADVS